MSLLEFFLPCAKGTQRLLSAELANFSVNIKNETASGITIECAAVEAYRFCLWSRVANRVLLKIATISADTSGVFYEGARSIQWEDYFKSDNTLLIHGHGQNKALRNSHYVALRLKDAVCDYCLDRFKVRPNIEKDSPEVQLHVFIRGKQADLYFDFSGESLHKRGYRRQVTRAPLKETLAAALVLQCGFLDLVKNQGHFMDPLCGAGTLVLEAAMMACDMAPNVLRHRFGFHAWAHYEKLIWDDLKKEAIDRAESGRKNYQGQLLGFDHMFEPLSVAKQSARLLNLETKVSFSQKPLQKIAWPAGNGLLLSNPPYGKRLGDDNSLRKLYQTMEACLFDKPPLWHLGIFTADRDYPKHQKKRSDKIYSFYNGRLHSQLYYYR